MVTLEEQLRWKEFQEKFHSIIVDGFEKGLIQIYDDELLDRLRTVYYGSVPATILLLHEKMSNGHCYDRASLVTLGFGDDDFRVVYADVDEIKLNPRFVERYRQGLLGDNYADYCFAERICEDGSVWVYDTSLGLVFDKDLYYQLENPVIRHTNDRNSTLEFLYEDFYRDADIERDKYALPLILPYLEQNMVATQPFYEEMLRWEINYLKETIHYDEVVSEMEEDMRQKYYRK